MVYNDALKVTRLISHLPGGGGRSGRRRRRRRRKGEAEEKRVRRWKGRGGRRRRISLVDNRMQALGTIDYGVCHQGLGIFRGSVGSYSIPSFQG